MSLRRGAHIQYAGEECCSKPATLSEGRGDIQKTYGKPGVQKSKGSVKVWGEGGETLKGEERKKSRKKTRLKGRLFARQPQRGRKGHRVSKIRKRPANACWKSLGGVWSWETRERRRIPEGGKRHSGLIFFFLEKKAAVLEPV